MAKAYSKETGFWRKGEGCILHRKYRPALCLYYNCLVRRGIKLPEETSMLFTLIKMDGLDVYSLYSAFVKIHFNEYHFSEMKVNKRRVKIFIKTLIGKTKSSYGINEFLVKNHRQ